SALELPVRLAFFFRHDGRWAAFYPGPAGATESTLPAEAWEAFLTAVPLAGVVEPEVEALLVAAPAHGGASGPSDPGAWLLPISACYELVGRVKRSWRGFDGGEETWRELDDFFAHVRARSEPWP